MLLHLSSFKTVRTVCFGHETPTGKKQPKHIKELLLEAAGAIAATRGVEAITLDGVARDAGVSGGPLHHFPSRRALIDALCGLLLARWDEGIVQIIDAR